MGVFFGKKKNFRPVFRFSAKRKYGRFSVIPAGTGPVVNVGHFLGGRMVPPSFVDLGPKLRVLIILIGEWPEMAKFRPGGRKTARRAAKRPPTGKPKLSRVASGYGGLMIPLSRVRRTLKNGGFISVA